jgi:hypothetical protein
MIKTPSQPEVNAHRTIVHQPKVKTPTENAISHREIKKKTEINRIAWTPFDCWAWREGGWLKEGPMASKHQVVQDWGCKGSGASI